MLDLAILDLGWQPAASQEFENVKKKIMLLIKNDRVAL